MRLLADENFPGSAVEILRTLGHEVIWIRTDAPGMPDVEILAWANRENRIILTFDKDFGELAYRHRLPAACGIILFRFAPPPQRAGRIIADIVASRDDWRGQFSVIDRGRIRMRTLI